MDMHSTRCGGDRTGSLPKAMKLPILSSSGTRRGIRSSDHAEIRLGCASGNAMAAGVAFGERSYARNQFNEDLLLGMADHYMTAKNAEKTLLYAGKLVDYLGSKPKPEGVSDADWKKKKNTMIGLGHWMAGTTYAQQKNLAQLDKLFRAALPYIKDNDQLLVSVLFQLGLANYQMGRGKSAAMMADAIRFTQQCAAIKGPMQAQAQKNLTVMRKETGQAK